MKLNEYQKKAALTAKYPTISKRYVYPALGLAGESGEVLDLVKKIFRNHKGKITPEYRKALKDELGDVLWYVAMLSRDFNFDLEDVAKLNLKKLDERLKKGTLHKDSKYRK
ncbi:MAG: nucleoside triphosphate pyrophosphohydrolase family protein [Candidatus Falkowbacteria bacterium]|nr:nucleoside triphosphate pyrophosphohydrolase family protein [Candidatus Falkowbacteria bacterium]